MHPNPVFRGASDTDNLSFARARGFGVMSINGEAGPLAAHVPFLVSDCGGYVDLHLVRSNPVARALVTPVPALLAVSGPDSYISPDWYGVPDQVPTWNYVAVHLRGVLSLRPDEELREVLTRLSARFERDLLPKSAWLMDKVDDDALARMMRQIVPCRMQVDAIDGTWKLGQNKPDIARRTTATGVEDSGIGHELQQLSALMRDAEQP